MGGLGDIKAERVIRDIRYITSHKKSRNVNVIFYGIGAQAMSGAKSFIEHSEEIAGDKLESIVLAGDSHDEAVEATHLLQSHLKESPLKIPRSKIIASTRDNIQDEFEHFESQESPFTIMVMSHSKPLLVKGSGNDERIAQTRGNIEVIDELNDLLGDYCPDHILCVSNLPEALMYRMGQTYDMDLRRFSGCSHLDKLRFDLAMAEHLANLGNSDMNSSSKDEIQSLLGNWEIWEKIWFGVGYHGNVRPVFIDGYVENGLEILRLRRLGFDLSENDKYEFSKKIALMPEEQVKNWKKAGDRKPRAPTDTGNAIRSTLLAIINEAGWVNNSIAYKPFRNSDQVLFMALPVRYRNGLAYYDPEYMNSPHFTKDDKKEFLSRAKELKDFIVSVDGLMAGNGTLEYSGDLDVVPTDADNEIDTALAKRDKVLQLEAKRPVIEEPIAVPRKDLRSKLKPRNGVEAIEAAITAPSIAHYYNLEADLKAGIKKQSIIPEGHHGFDFVIPVSYSGTLKINPGAKIDFGEKGGIDVLGTLIAEGTEDKPIILGEYPWLGISFLGSTGNKLDYCVISNASKEHKLPEKSNYFPAIDLRVSTIELNNTQFYSCSLGAIYSHKSFLEVDNCIIHDYGKPINEYILNQINKYKKDISYSDHDICRFGAFWVSNSIFYLNNSIIDSGDLSAIRLLHSNYIITDTEINKVNDNHIVLAYNSSGQILGGDFKNNTSVLGTISVFGGAFEICCGTKLRNNKAERGGAIFIACGPVARAPHIDGIDILENSAQIGGGIYTSLSDILIENCNIEDNTANFCGGIGYVYSRPKIICCTLNGNRPDNISKTPSPFTGKGREPTEKEEIYVMRKILGQQKETHFSVEDLRRELEIQAPTFRKESRYRNLFPIPSK